MSHAYQLVCKTCLLSTEEFRRYGKDEVKKFVNNWKENKIALNRILELDLFGFGDIRSALESKSLPPDIYEFMLAHESHELVIRSEYHPSVEDEVIMVKAE
jgi:hypothetical protein